MTSLSFQKWQGVGNHFVVLDLISHPLPPDFDFPAAALRLCEPRFGVGGDGLLTLEPAMGAAAVRMRMWNPDGTEDMCGNGLRCVAARAWEQKHASQPHFEVETSAGNRQIEVLGPHSIRAAMGKPIFAPSQVPISLAEERENAIGIEIPLPEITLPATVLSTGSTHTVVFLSEPLSKANFQKWSPLVENHPLFPARTSVMWAVPYGPNRFQIRIWERGAGETFACGTGACAVAVAAQMTRRAGANVEIESRGGVLHIQWTRGQEIFLTGPARPIFSGIWSG